LKTRPRFPLGLLELDRDIGAASPYEYVMENEMVKRRMWHVDFAGAMLISAAMLAAYYFDGPTNPNNAIKPVTTKTPNPEHRLKCVDGQNPVEWRCPEGSRI
jgi:hypothetical protein